MDRATQAREIRKLIAGPDKILIVEREWVSGRIEVILVREPIGI